MEQCEPPQCDKGSASVVQGEENQKLEAHGEVGNSETNDFYECRICGYKAADVCSLSQHLHSFHPVTGLPGPKATKDVEGREADNDDTQAAAVLRDQTSEGQKSPPTGNPEFSEESLSSSPMDSEETSTSTCNVENQLPAVEQRLTVKNPPAAKVSQSTSPVSILPRRKSSSSSESTKGNQSETAASSGTSSLNQTHFVCLPLVSEGLKLVWVRSEQTHELDAVSELVEAFNAFPYPTEQEASALARRCSLPPERVKVWFMMQRVRYGISWADDDIRQTRLKLHLLQRTSLVEECEEEEEGEEEGFLAHQENMSRTLQQSSVMDAYMEQVYHTPKPVLPQDEAMDYSSKQNSIITQFTNGLELLVQNPANALYMGDISNAPLDKDNAQLHRDLKHLPHHEPRAESSSTYGPSPKPARARRGATVQQRKKSKDQLMVLRRSFVQTNWPTEAEVQRLQRVTGLGRHEIRKWFADSRYQLRRSGRSWVTEMTRLSQSPESLERTKQSTEDDFPEYGEPIDSSEGLDYEPDVEMEDHQAPVEDDNVSESNERKEDASEELEVQDSPINLKKERKEIAVIPSPSPASSSPSPSLLPHLGPEPNLRKKTWEQLNMLRQSFLLCQWPTSDDYTLLQQKTGLTRTEIVQWYGDTRYHIKHSNLRWIRPEDRDRVRVGVMKQQKRAGKGPRNRGWLEVKEPKSGFKGPQPSNGIEAGEPRTWEELYKATPSVLPGGEL